MNNKSLAILGKKENSEVNSGLHILRELNNEEIEIVESSLVDISELKALVDSKHILEKNYFEFLSFIDNKNKFLADHISVQHSIDFLMLESNRLLSNVLFSLTASIDHFKGKLNLEEKDDFNKKLSNLFDSNPNYAFIYKLRNYAQHKKLPISKLDINDKLGAQKNAQIFVIKNELMNNYDSWSKVKPFLESLPETFDIAPLLISAVTGLYEVYVFFQEIHIEKIKKSIDCVLNYIQEGITQGNLKGFKLVYPCFVDSVKQINISPHEFNLSITYFPIKFLDDIGIIKVNNWQH